MSVPKFMVRDIVSRLLKAERDTNLWFLAIDKVTLGEGMTTPELDVKEEEIRSILLRAFEEAFEVLGRKPS